MKVKYLFLSFVAFLVFFSGLEMPLSGEAAPPPQPPHPPAAKVQIHVWGPLDDLEVSVRPWLIHVGGAGPATYVDWTLRDHGGLVQNFTVNNEGKTTEQGCPSFPDRQNPNNRERYGPFTGVTDSNDGWCSYSIILEIDNGDGTSRKIIIDPEYKVVPGAGIP